MQQRSAKGQANAGTGGLSSVTAADLAGGLARLKSATASPAQVLQHMWVPHVRALSMTAKACQHLVHGVAYVPDRVSQKDAGGGYQLCTLQLPLHNSLGGMTVSWHLCGAVHTCALAACPSDVRVQQAGAEVGKPPCRPPQPVNSRDQLMSEIRAKAGKLSSRPAVTPASQGTANCSCIASALPEIDS